MIIGPIYTYHQIHFTSENALFCDNRNGHLAVPLLVSDADGRVISLTRRRSRRLGECWFYDIGWTDLKQIYLENTPGTLCPVIFCIARPHAKLYTGHVGIAIISVRPSVCLTFRYWVKRLNVSSKFFDRPIASIFSELNGNAEFRRSHPECAR